MRFVLDAEQKLFGETLHRLLADADLPEAIRSWACGAHDPGRAIWSALAEAGVFAIAVPEAFDGAGPLPVELVTAAYELGRAGVPGPWVETFAAAELLSQLDGRHLPEIATGASIASIAFPPELPYALDADVAGLVLLIDGADVHLAEVSGPSLKSLDPARRLFAVAPVSLLAAAAPTAVAAAYDVGVLACAAQLVGIGRALLDVSVGYAKARQQFGRPIGEFQAVKHHLANALVCLEYAKPLVYGAALSYRTPDFPRDVSAAKVAASEAAYRTAKIALQVHGAIGYTDEYDPSLLIRKARALHSAWGSPSHHRGRVLAAL